MKKYTSQRTLHVLCLELLRILQNKRNSFWQQASPVPRPLHFAKPLKFSGTLAWSLMKLYDKVMFWSILVAHPSTIKTLPSQFQSNAFVMTNVCGVNLILVEENNLAVGAPYLFSIAQDAMKAATLAWIRQLIPIWTLLIVVVHLERFQERTVWFKNSKSKSTRSS